MSKGSLMIQVRVIATTLKEFVSRAGYAKKMGRVAAALGRDEVVT